jgi:hypothetical protein
VSDYVYLYGFVPPDAPAPQHLAGINNSDVKLEPAGAFNAAVSRVPESEYAPERIEARLQDLPWVAEQGVAHERVVAWFVDHSEILPAPLFTMYSSADAMKMALAARENEVRAEMQRLHGLREWDLKISFDEQALRQNAAQVSEKIAEIDREIASAPAGKSYLLQKKRTDLLKVEVRQAAHRKAVSILNALHPAVEQTRALPLPRNAESLPVVLHAALLVRLDRQKDVIAQLEQHARDLRALGMDLAFSGPWAPYRFMGDHEQG